MFVIVRLFLSPLLSLCPTLFSFLTPAILNFCANNYLGLSSHPEVVQAGVDALNTYGAGLSSVRFICGTQVQGYTLTLSLSHPMGQQVPSP